MEATRHVGAAMRPPTADARPRAAGSPAVATAASGVADGSGPSAERLSEQRLENLNYVMLGVCMVLSNAWFATSVLQFT